MKPPPASRFPRLVALLLFFPVLLQAHPGHTGDLGLDAGFLHPLSGIDHLLAMVAVGLWAAQLGGRARWVVPGSFLGAMIIGALLGSAGFTLPLLDVTILVSLVALGICIFGIVRLPLALASAAVAGFALFHGNAHGAEMPASASGLAYGAGFVAATALLHATGLALGRWSQRFPATVLQFCGGSIALAGIGLLLT